MNMLRTLENNRIPIILAEIGAYLHLIGRFSKEFIDSNAKDATGAEKNFDYKNVCNTPGFFDTGLHKLLTDQCWETLLNSFNTPNNIGELFNSKIKDFSEFIEKHIWNSNKKSKVSKAHNKPKGLCKILADAHGIVSGIDKALAGRGESGKQKKAYTFKATAFGYEKEIELIKNPELKEDLFQKIKKFLNNIKNKQDISYKEYQDFVFIMKDYYSKTIGETRRPINEISLYDYAHTIASLMKSNLAKIIIDGWYEPKGKSKWRILNVNIDVIGLISKGLKIGDILGNKKEIEKVYDNIKRVIEFEYPLGNEIYRDSTGIYFSCPDINDINNLKLEIIEKLKNLNTLDFSLQIEISDKSRSMVILARERDEALKKISYLHVGDMENIKREFEESCSTGGRDICPVCRIRLKPERDNRCKKCKDKYEKRAEAWLGEEENLKETIWLDEVADKNDRVALIVGQFDLRKWLSGEFIDTFVSQTFDEWGNIYVDRNHSKKALDICNSLGIKDFLDLRKGFESLFNNPKNLDNNWKKICNSFIRMGIKDFKNNFWKPIAERDATGKALKLKDDSEKAKHLVKLLFRKHPSPARIYRIWNTTHEFIKETIFENILKEYNWNLELRRRRIQFKIEPNPNIPEKTTCDIDVDGLRFSPVYTNKENGIFISTINLEILKKLGKTAKEISENLNGRRIKVKTDKDKTWKNKKGGKIFKIINSGMADEKFQNYLPYIKIFEFPELFMVLVPAYDALDITEKILKEYETQFSKVRDRLSFHLGIISFHRKTPLYLVMDAGKRLLRAFKRETTTKLAKVISIEDVESEKLGNCKELIIKVESQSSIPLKWKISYSTKDPDQEDLWHPYIRVDGAISDRNLYFDYTGNEDYTVHVKEIRENDKIKIEPSYFRLFYLENAADRFNVDEDLKLLDCIHHLKKLWKEMEDKLKSEIWSISQVYAYWEEVRKRRNNYDEDTFKKFTKAALTNILKINPQENKELFNLFFQATINRIFDLCLYWNLLIRKIKLKGG